MRFFEQYLLRKNDDRLPKIALFSNPYRTKLEGDRSANAMGSARKKEFKGNWTSLAGSKREALDSSGWKRRRPQLCWPQSAWCSKKLVFSLLQLIIFQIFLKTFCLSFR